MITQNIILYENSIYRAIAPSDGNCSSCDLREKECWKMPKENSCLASDREDGCYVNFQKLNVINYKLK